MALWIIFAVMTAAAFTLLLRPFNTYDKNNVQSQVETDIYRDQLEELERDLEDGVVSPQEAEAARTEISRRILETATVSKGVKKSKNNANRHKFTIVAMLILVPAVSLSLYLALGEPNFSNVLKNQSAKTKTSAPLSIEALTQKVEAHLKENPDDLKGWLLLANTYLKMERSEDAARALENINRIRANVGDIASLPDEERGLMIRAMVIGLHQKLKQDGNDLEGWQQLIRSYIMLGQKEDAASSYLEAREALSANQKALASLKLFMDRLGIRKEK